MSLLLLEDFLKEFYRKVQDIFFYLNQLIFNFLKFDYVFQNELINIF